MRRICSSRQPGSQKVHTFSPCFLQELSQVPGVPGLTGLYVPRSVVEELRPDVDCVTVQYVKVVLMLHNRVKFATLRNVVDGFPGVSGQTAPGSVVEEQETGPEIVRRGRFVREQEMRRNIATLRNVKVL